ncbi:hypothetical protein DdX_12072 [Ditylenchus destructor]|uniref:Uncharacterized protein n=1 Tax=Ditylenchus destructor TaxID=166010 RepID=A0AAD4MZ32_9BILA|nr:hypothetical protein DdX_12072 [Ditylenchus destructor]
MSPNLWCPSLTQKFTRKTKLRHGREKWKVKEGAGRRPPQFPTRGPSPQIVCPIFSLNAQQRSSPLWCGGDYCAIAIYGPREVVDRPGWVLRDGDDYLNTVTGAGPPTLLAAAATKSTSHLSFHQNNYPNFSLTGGGE